MSAVIEPALEAQLSEPKWHRAPVEYSRGWSALLASLDIVMFSISAYLAAVIIFHTLDFTAHTRPLVSSVACILIWLFIFERVGLYRRSFALSVKDEFYFTVAAICLGILPQLVLFTLIPSISTSRVHLLLSAAISIALVGSSRAITHGIRLRIAKNCPRRIAVVGNADRVDIVQEALNMVEGTKVLRLEEPNVDQTIKAVNLAVDPELDSIPWFCAAKQWGCDTLILTEMLPPYIMPHLLEICARRRISVAFAPPRVQRHAYSLTLRTDGRQALIVPSPLRSCTPTARLLKRIFDLSVAVPAFLFFSPAMLIAAVAIWLESGRPILYRQKRVGRMGVVFDLLKFRSMRVDAEANTGPVYARLDDGRMTKVGAILRRTSIDELPQLLNVLHGEMSIVGPRPERPIFVERFRRQLLRYDERHLVRPGMTGWTQVQMKRALIPSDAGEKLSYDLFYLEQWSLFMDVSVVFKTAAEVLFHRPA